MAKEGLQFTSYATSVELLCGEWRSEKNFSRNIVLMTSVHQKEVSLRHVSANSILLADTASTNNKGFASTDSANNKQFAATIPAKSKWFVSFFPVHIDETIMKWSFLDVI